MTNDQSKYIVFFASTVRSDTFDLLLDKHRSLIQGDIKSLNEELKPLPALQGYIATISSSLVPTIRNQPETLLIEQDQLVALNFSRSQTRQTVTQTRVYSWGIDRLDGRVDGKFNYPDRAGEGVTIYILDTGIRRSHLDLSTRGTVQGSRVVEAVSFINEPAAVEDGNGHGTHVAGTASGTYSGVAKRSFLKSVKVLDARGEGSLSSIIAGLNWVLADRARVNKQVVNLSLGSGRSDAVNQAVSRLIRAGIVVIAAAGNEDQNACATSPSSEPAVISVGATTSRDMRASFSNYGQCVDIQAPGAEIVSSNFQSNDGLAVLSGTSMAAPHVAGIAAVIMSIQGGTPDQIRTALLQRAQYNVITGLPSQTTNILAQI